ncbi:MAG: nucleoside-diphosphate kinase [Chlamydiae bacterium CG10_big_fil_rev_8_21_14_0_10_42_34]|nr:MAG: nucleoside-diphosphate kinase [Chlamydiae bacterium CG10_big_fil_rev_8_21_14_0_10_42_34]
MIKFFLFAASALFAEQTFSIIKPDAVESNKIGDIESYLETSGLNIVAAKLIHLTPEQAQEFYAVHKDRPFYKDLVAYMTSGPVLVQVLEGEDAVALNRKVMGSTNPKEASAGTIRADFGTDIQRNAVHGSDSLENAKKEISFFFKPEEIHPCTKSK